MADRLINRVSTSKVIHEIEKSGNLYFLLNAFIGAYNRRTDVMQRASETDPARIKALTQKLDKAGSALKDAVDNNQPE